jgi:Carbohydrate esterase, sialic acid-specific acetylesterase
MAKRGMWRGRLSSISTRSVGCATGHATLSWVPPETGAARGDGLAQSILLCPLSVGGATVRAWAPGGTYHHRMIYGIERLREAGFHPSYVLWHQGEADALYGTSADHYANAFRA